MTPIKAREKEDLHAVLAASGRSPEIPESADAYGWLIGSWELDVRHYVVDVAARGIKGEAHFGWVLEGRAVQDVWIMPRRSERTADLDKTMQHVRHDAPRVGPVDSGLAGHVDQSGDRTAVTN